ncbi:MULTISPECIES: DNA ligase [unclassified Helicobacter]|uniref:DNA ligase n=1 Tax=unclassified Helicobacter TaxID=2593540 RepID=UPI000CF1A693|nr:MULTISPECIES: DNA ligase [unclassified Helicobacter]
MLGILLFLICICKAYALDLIHPVVLQNIDTIEIKDYFVSEKLDGIRAYWDGKTLLSRSGKNLNPPKWFIKDFPPFAIDGELFTKQGDFETIVSIVKNQQNKILWENLSFYVFEVPNKKGDLLERIKHLQDFLKSHQPKFIKIIPQYQFHDKTELLNFIEQVRLKDGEGIILRRKGEPYVTGRNPSSLKYKFFFDSECKIIEYQKGKGKYANVVGSLTCKDGDKTFRIGSGFSDDFRKNPPKIGSIITYKFYKTTKNNIPRHPVFLRLYREF